MIRILALLIAMPAQAAEQTCFTYAYVTANAPFQKDVIAVVDLFIPGDTGSVKLQRYNDGSAAIFYFDEKGCIYHVGGVRRHDVDTLIRKFGGTET